MNYKFMRLLVFFDLPMLTDKDKREYQKFHKYLVRNGFIMMQKSVYSKLVINNVTSASVKQRIKNNLPPGIEYLVGEEQQITIDSMDRLVEV